MTKFKQTIITEDIYYSQQSTEEEDGKYGNERNIARSKARWKAVII